MGLRTPAFNRDWTFISDPTFIRNFTVSYNLWLSVLICSSSSVHDLHMHMHLRVSMPYTNCCYAAPSNSIHLLFSAILYYNTIFWSIEIIVLSNALLSLKATKQILGQECHYHYQSHWLTNLHRCNVLQLPRILSPEHRHRLSWTTQTADSLWFRRALREPCICGCRRGCLERCQLIPCWHHA